MTNDMREREEERRRGWRCEIEEVIQVQTAGWRDCATGRL